MDSETVRRKATRGAWHVALRLLATRGIGLIGIVYISRELGPHGLGYVALAAIIQTGGHVLSDAGLGPSLISREASPTRRELSAVLGLQLALTCALAIVATGGAIVFGGAATVVAVALWSLPCYAMRTPPMILADRDLNFRPSAISEVVEAVVYTSLAITLVALGAGPLGVVSATVAAALVDSVVFLALLPAGLVMPTFRVSRVRHLFAFAARFQLSQVLEVGRAQLIAVCVVAVGGLRILGYSGLVDRLLQVPLVVMTPVSRVAFPTFSRLLQTGEDVGAVAVRATRTLTCVMAFVTAPVIACSALIIEPVFGAEWRPASGLLAAQGFALLIGVPTSFVMTAVVFARQQPGAVVRIQVVVIAVSVVGAAVLLALLGPVGLGLGLVIGASVELMLYDRIARREFGRSLLAAVLPVVAACIVVGLGGLALSTTASPTLYNSLIFAASSAVCYGALTALFFRDVFRALSARMQRREIRDLS